MRNSKESEGVDEKSVLLFNIIHAELPEKLPFVGVAWSQSKTAVLELAWHKNIVKLFT